MMALIIVPFTSRLKTSALTDSSTSAARIMVKYDKVNKGRSRVDKKLSKSQKTLKAEKVLKAIGLEERLPKHRSPIHKEPKLLLKL